MTSWEHPASFTCPKHRRPSLITAHSGSRLRLAKMEIACPQKLVTRRNFSRTGLPSGVVSTARRQRRLAGGTSSTFAAGPLTSEIGVVEINASCQRLAGIAFEHDLLQFVLHLPGGGLGHTEAAPEFDAGNALFTLGHVVHRPEPQAQRQFGRLEDRSGDRRRLPTAGGALIKVSGLHHAVLLAAANGALEAIGPSGGDDSGPTLRLVHRHTDVQTPAH